MRRFLLAATLGLAAPSAFACSQEAPLVVAVADTVASDTLAARAVRAEAFFFGGKSAELRAMGDTLFASMLTDEGHAQLLAYILGIGGAEASGDWEAFVCQGMKGYRRPYIVEGLPAWLKLLFNADGQIAGLEISKAD